jgi:hypothetical protein
MNMAEEVKKSTRKPIARKTTAKAVATAASATSGTVVTSTTNAATTASATPVALTPEQIRERAYFLFLQRGGQPGHALEDWLQAEREAVGAGR